MIAKVPYDRYETASVGDIKSQEEDYIGSVSQVEPQTIHPIRTIFGYKHDLPVHEQPCGPRTRLLVPFDQNCIDLHLKVTICTYHHCVLWVSNTASSIDICARGTLAGREKDSLGPTYQGLGRRKTEFGASSSGILPSRFPSCTFQGQMIIIMSERAMMV